ncbi:hypothetical protein [Planktothrix mougeotii]|uniref:hypothetical protein n=1 Tax=Planktothrix mougeotii TaxID=54306 RepID=UPI001D1374B3|nr:hypothetical protein [Planktothrix mougeotii]
MAGLLRASEEGLKIIDMVRRNLGWNKTEDAWCLAALVLTATLKRFWARIGIRRENFINICKAVEIENWEYIAEGYKIKKTEPLLAAVMPAAGYAYADISLDSESDKNFPLPENLPPVRNWVNRTRANLSEPNFCLSNFRISPIFCCNCYSNAGSESI